MSICSKCQSNEIEQETYDELPLDQFEIFTDEERIESPGACCSICGKQSEQVGIDFYTIEPDSESTNGHIYCPEHYIKVKWLMLTYGLILLDAEANIHLSEGRKIL